MAVQSTKRMSRNTGFWIAGGLLLLLVSWFLITERNKASTQVQTIESDSSSTGGPQFAAAVSNFTTFTEVKSGDDGSVTHDYTANGLRLLAAALELAPSHANVGDGPSGIRARADSMQQDVAATSHARQTSEAALMASELISHLQTDGRPWLDAKAVLVNDAARAIKPDQLLLPQMSAVQLFFQQSAAALRAVNKGS